MGHSKGPPLVGGGGGRSVVMRAGFGCEIMFSGGGAAAVALGATLVRPMVRSLAASSMLEGSRRWRDGGSSQAGGGRFFLRGLELFEID